MKLSRRQALKKTIEMWDWLADNPAAKKSDFFLKHRKRKIPIQYCYACDYAIKNEKLGKLCRCCPIDAWKVAFMECFSKTSPYRAWNDATDLEKRSQYARAVANLARESLENLEKE